MEKNRREPHTLIRNGAGYGTQHTFFICSQCELIRSFPNHSFRKSFVNFGFTTVLDSMFLSSSSRHRLSCAVCSCRHRHLCRPPHAWFEPVPVRIGSQPCFFVTSCIALLLPFHGAWSRIVLRPFQLKILCANLVA